MLTVVLGASPNPERYSNKAVNALLNNGFEVRAVGNREGTIAGIPIEAELPTDQKIDTVSMYLNRANQREYYQKIIDLAPRRVVFNPGSENPEFKDKLAANGIETEEACTLVMLSRGVYA